MLAAIVSQYSSYKLFEEQLIIISPTYPRSRGYNKFGKEY
jgi:hypothetical protein